MPSTKIYTLEEQKAHRKELINQLRDGTYEPLVVDGKFNRDGYTVAAIIKDVCWDHDSYYQNLNCYSETIDSCCREWFGFESDDGYYFQCDGPLFDNNELPFAYVADIIESEPHGLINYEEKIPEYNWESKRDDSYELEIDGKYGTMFDVRNIKWNIKETNETYTLTTTITTVETAPTLEKALQSAIHRGRLNHHAKNIRRLHKMGDKILGYTV